MNHSQTFCIAHFSASKIIQQQFPFKIHGVRCEYLMCNLASTTYLFYYVCSILCSLQPVKKDIYYLLSNDLWAEHISIGEKNVCLVHK